MALVASRSSTSRAEANLTEALRNFEEALSDQQKQDFCSAGPPSANAAVELATRIDNECIEKRRQCIGPRFIPVFELVQKCFRLFSEDLVPATDTFVSSHPERAALAWGGLKVVLLVANNVATKFDKISALLMSIGQQCRTVQALGSLHPSQGLHDARCEFLTAVVRFSRDVLKYLAQSIRYQMRHHFRKAKRILHFTCLRTIMWPEEEYIVAMMIIWDGSVAYRKGTAEIDRNIWTATRPKWKLIILGQKNDSGSR